MSILTPILTFFLSAFALKLALSMMGQPARRNKYGTAVTVSAILTICGWVLGFVPFFGWLVYAILWFAVIRSVYEISLKRSFAVALLLVLIRGGLSYLVGII